MTRQHNYVNGDVVNTDLVNSLDKSSVDSLLSYNLSYSPNAEPRAQSYSRLSNFNPKSTYVGKGPRSKEPSFGELLVGGMTGTRNSDACVDAATLVSTQRRPSIKHGVPTPAVISSLETPYRSRGKFKLTFSEEDLQEFKNPKDSHTRGLFSLCSTGVPANYALIFADISEGDYFACPASINKYVLGNASTILSYPHLPSSSVQLTSNLTQLKTPSLGYDKFPSDGSDSTPELVEGQMPTSDPS